MYSGYGYIAFHSDPVMPALRIETCYGEAFAIDGACLPIADPGGDFLSNHFVMILARRSDSDDPFYTRHLSESALEQECADPKTALLQLAARDVDSIAEGWAAKGYRLFPLVDIEARAGADRRTRCRVRGGLHGR